ncbi:hypothetical protein GMMP15_1460003 [Candidatus Magnetomoraceae bacterium gMMP-15]
MKFKRIVIGIFGIGLIISLSAIFTLADVNSSNSSASYDGTYFTSELNFDEAMLLSKRGKGNGSRGGNGRRDGSCFTSKFINSDEAIFLSRRGKGNGGRGGNGRRDGSCFTSEADLDNNIVLARRGQGNGRGNGRGNGNGGNGPGDGTGNGPGDGTGNGPGDGTGNGPGDGTGTGDCPNL